MIGQKFQIFITISGLIVISFLYLFLTNKSNEFILHVIVTDWSSGFNSRNRIHTYLIPIELNKQFSFNHPPRFIIDSIQGDSAIVLTTSHEYKIKNPAYAPKEPKSEIKIDLPILTVDFDTVLYDPQSNDGGTYYSFFIDTTELAKSIVKKNITPIIDITEIDNPADWVFKNEIFHPNGKIKLKWKEKYNERFRKVKDGLFEEWSISGIQICKINYSFGKLDGEILLNYPNGQLKMSGSFYAGIKEGDWKFFNVFGEITSSGSYLNGSGNLYFSNGNQKTQEIYDRSNNKFSQIAWYPNGQLKYLHERPNLKGKNELKGWLENGTEVSAREFIALREPVFNLGSYIFQTNNNNHDSLETEYYPNQKIKKKAFFDENGTLILIKRWYANGNLSTENQYKNGIASGFWRDWNIKGYMTQSQQFIDKDTAITIIYHINSEQIMMNGLKIKGRQNGIWNVYDNDGKLYSKMRYEKGKLISKEHL